MLIFNSALNILFNRIRENIYKFNLFFNNNPLNYIVNMCIEDFLLKYFYNDLLIII